MVRAPIPRPWLDVARAAFFERLYRGKSVLCVGIGDGGTLEVLLERGARHVAAVDGEAAIVERARRRLGARVDLSVGGPAAVRGRFDVIFVEAAGRLFAAEGGLEAVRQRLLPGGWLIAAVENGDRRPVEGALGYYDLHDRLTPWFPSVTMLGESALVGATVAPFGAEEVDPVLDVALADEQEAELYVAVAGPRRPPLPYGLVALPTAALAPPEAASAPRPEPAPATRGGEIASLQAALADLQRLESEQARLVEQSAEIARRASADQAALADARDRLSACERGLEAGRQAALHHAEEMRLAQAVLAERDAYIGEMEREIRAVDGIRSEAREAVGRAEQAEGRERGARRRVAELEGAVLRLEHLAAARDGAIDEARVVELSQKVAGLEARCEKLQVKADDAQREAWGHLKARSDAEAAAAEVREDTVRKLKDARKIANAELMRAMEEATRKAVALKEELTRTERERKEAVAALKGARQELDAERAGLDEKVRAAAAAESARVLEGLEARLLTLEAERDQAIRERDALRSAASEGTPAWGTDAAERCRESAVELALLAGALEQERARLAAIEEGLRRATEEVGAPEEAAGWIGDDPARETGSAE